MAAPAYLPTLALKFWTPLTYMFTHVDFLHILFNMLWLFWLGKIFIDFLKQRQFVFVYLAGGLAGVLLFILAFNFLPAFKNDVQFSAPLIGASASVMAVVVATATLLPNYSIMLLFFGEVRLKYLAIGYIILSLIDILSNPGGSFAHLGGALFGFIYIKQLQSGNDWSKIFAKRSKLKVVRKNKSASRGNIPDQDVIDNILDKISRSGYDSLTKFEKEQLFNASKKNEP
ncbi:rhomboid family intramembrane serine protease [Pedobacter sp. HMF7647]|uniref:Rhomboid family intramembrane serine protease n=1 Tax=Hufsiella arboris TaxID=2695275 RepID=A0A7K1YB14_9SPHI|nr:rhomboid family intramembrane serine protease [Hufsiella arboris]